MTHAAKLEAHIRTQAAALIRRVRRAAPADRVKQATAIVRRRDSEADAFEKAITDTAFNAVFDHMTDAETQVWRIWRMFGDEVKPQVSERMTRLALHPEPMKVAA